MSINDKESFKRPTFYRMNEKGRAGETEEAKEPDSAPNFPTLKKLKSMDNK